MGTPSLSLSSAILVPPQLKRPRLLRSVQALARHSSRQSRRRQDRSRGSPSCATRREVQVLSLPFLGLRIRIDLHELKGVSSFHPPLLNLLILLELLLEFFVVALAEIASA